MACLFALAVAAAGCGDDEDDGMGGADAGTGNPDAAAACTVAAWSSPDFDTNAADALALRDRLGTLVSFMRDVEQETAQPPLTMLSQLTDLYEAGDPSLSDAITTDYDGIMDDGFADFFALSANPAADLIDDQGDWDPGDDGGIFGTRQAGINAGGLEIRQLVDKGLYSAVSYHYALGLTEGTITPATIDAIAAAWGTDGALTPDVDDAAHYSYEMGFHAPIAEHLTAARAYAADPDCTAERDEAIVDVFRTWELAVMARAVFYANAGATGFADAETDDEFADTLHALAEGVGLALGFYGMPDPSSGPLAGEGRLITDAQLETMMTAIGVNIDDLSASTTGTYVADPTGFAAGVVDFEAEVEDAYGLTEAEVDAFHDSNPG